MDMIRDGFSEAFQLLLNADPLVLDAAFRSVCISLAAVIAASAVGIPIGSALGRRSFPGRAILVIGFRSGMSIPTVLIGLICYAMFSRRGPLGELDLLYTPEGIAVGEFLLAVPIVVTWTYGAIRNQDPRLAETAMTLGAGTFRRWVTYLSESRFSIILAVLTAFSRCFTELGIAMMVGGNIRFRTRTLSTATALETARGEFGRGVAMSLILLLIAIAVTIAVACLSRSDKADES